MFTIETATGKRASFNTFEEGFGVLYSLAGQLAGHEDVPLPAWKNLCRMTCSIDGISCSMNIIELQEFAREQGLLNDRVLDTELTLPPNMVEEEFLQHPQPA